MNVLDEVTVVNRRAFLKGLAGSSGALLLVNSLTTTAAEAAPHDWSNQIGLELFTVRDLLQKDYAGTLAQVAEIGYKEIEPAGGYGGLDPKEFRALLDRLGLQMPSTHSGAQEGPGLEKQLEGFRIMGLKYIEISSGGMGPAGGPGGAPAAGARPPAAPRPMAQQTEETVKRQVDQLNKHGEIAKRFGMKMLVHNHTQEFAPLAGSNLRAYDILLSGTDPALVAMQLDIGWASVAGQNIVEMFRKNPGRFELWHVKDAKGLKGGPPKDLRTTQLVPVGTGEIDYKTIFANAEVAGLKHFCVEQDNAAESGDAIAAIRTSYRNLKQMLS
jgi:sugar phosphate isomerase/epimerase